jgi:osmoprotectant transport system permease protein
MRWLFGLLMFLVAWPVAAEEPLVVGSKPFTENRLLAEIMAQLIEARLEVPVERRTNLGGTMVVFEALRSGAIDLYPEYTGTGWIVLLQKTERQTDKLHVYDVVRRESQERWGLVWLSVFGFNNSYALAVRRPFAEEHQLTRISQLPAVASQIRAGVSHEFLAREDGFPGLEKHYGLVIPGLRGMEHGLAYEAIQAGEVDLVDTWTTDGKLKRFDVVVLEDDLSFFPPYDAAPLVRADTLAEYPELGPVLEELAWTLPDARMMALNAAIEVDLKGFEEVAAQFLADQGLVHGVRTISAGEGDRNAATFAGFMVSRAAVTWDLVLEHLALTGIAVFLAVLVSVPLGVGVAKVPAASGVLTVAGVIQTVPSLALLAMMIPVLGLGVPAAVTALFLYALLPILRNTATAILEVDADLIEAGRGMGMTDWQLLTKVELPLSVATIMAGIRTSTVISIGVATLAAFIGAGGLGDPIVTGLQLNDTRLILAGALPAAALAVLVDALLHRIERLLVPKGLD